MEVLEALKAPIEREERRSELEERGSRSSLMRWSCSAVE